MAINLWSKGSGVQIQAVANPEDSAHYHDLNPNVKDKFDIPYGNVELSTEGQTDMPVAVNHDSSVAAPGVPR